MAAFDNALGISPQVLAIRAQRMNLLTTNLANADTPNYKARDIDFKAALQAAEGERSSNRLTATDANHFGVNTSSSSPDVMYRLPSEISDNGNTVEKHREQSAFMENSIKYQVSLQLLDSRIKGLKTAIKGGQ